VVIADIRNNTGDPAFGGALEPTLRRALESASFISAYERARISATFGVRPPETLDEAEALAFAAKQGLGVVLSGAIGRRGNGYEISVKSVQAVTGTVVVDTSARAASKEQILDVLTRLVSAVRRALGDETSDSAQMFAMRSISATSLEVVRLYAAALDAQSDGKYEEARQNALKAVQLDPEFGMGYSLLGGMSRNLGNLQDAEKFSSQALSYLDGMTERERFAARGFYYRVAGDHQQCVKEYGDMTALFAADVGAHNQRALCLSKLRKMRESVDEIRKAVEILPRRVLFRGNLAVYAAYSGDFQTAEQEVRAVQEPNDLVTLALAFAQSGQGLLHQASETFEALRAMSPRGASWAASGLAQLALYEGRISQAIGLLEDGASADLAAGNADRAARKLVSLAFAHLVRGETAPAIAAAEKALRSSHPGQIRSLPRRRRRSSRSGRRCPRRRHGPCRSNPAAGEKGISGRCRISPRQTNRGLPRADSNAVQTRPSGSAAAALAEESHRSEMCHRRRCKRHASSRSAARRSDRAIPAPGTGSSSRSGDLVCIGVRTYRAWWSGSRSAQRRRATARRCVRVRAAWWTR
jgi:tetratricopeptide (TPR) repeat protein